MEKNIFEGAKFGDKFATRDNKVVLFLYCDYETDPHSYNCWIDGIGHLNYSSAGKQYDYPSDSCTVLDIVSKYQEPIDEEKLDELAKDWNVNYAIHPLPNMDDEEEYTRKDVVEAFKYGYRKAIER